MGKHRYTADQIIVKLREVEVHCSQGKTLAEAVCQIGVTENTYYRWRREYVGMNTSDAKKMKDLEKRERPSEKVSGGSKPRQRDLEGCQLKKLLSPVKRNAAVAYVVEHHGVTDRRACQVLYVNRTAYRYKPVKREDEDEIRSEIIEKACNFGRVGYRKVADMLRNDGRKINHKCVERIWREEGLKLPKKQTKKRRLFLADGSCIRLRPTHKNHVWSYDFMEDRTMDGRKVCFLNIIDEFTRECLASIPRRNWRNNDVIEVLTGLMLQKGTPEYLRSDNGSEFTAKKMRKWLSNVGVITAYIEPGSPWENGYCESFNGRMRDEFLNGELFGNMYEAQVLTRRWLTYYSTIRPHSSLGGRPPAPQAVILPAA